VTVVVALVVGWMLLTDGDGASTEAAGSSTSEFVEPAVVVPGPTADVPEQGTGAIDGGDARSSIGVSGLPAAFVDELPPEASDVIDAIRAGGPHPYRQDGSTFQNREGLLPFEREGYYREYTVETPGSPDRGARRIVTGERGAVFYTDDHYASFVEVVDADL
jgi:ribonuclease T1